MHLIKKNTRRKFDFTQNLLAIYKLRRTTTLKFIQLAIGTGGLDLLFIANI